MCVSRKQFVITPPLCQEHRRSENARPLSSFRMARARSAFVLALFASCAEGGMLQGALGSRDVMRLGGAPINSITTDRPSGGGAGIGRQLDAMLRALNPRRKAKGSGDAKRRPSYSIQFLAPFWIISHLAAKHAQLLLQWSSPLRRLNCLPLAGATLFQAKEGTQMMLVRTQLTRTPATHLSRAFLAANQGWPLPLRVACARVLEGGGICWPWPRGQEHSCSRGAGRRSPGLSRGCGAALLRAPLVRRAEGSPRIPHPYEQQQLLSP